MYSSLRRAPSILGNDGLTWLSAQEEYERQNEASVSGLSRVMTKGDLKLYAICGSVLGYFHAM